MFVLEDDVAPGGARYSVAGLRGTVSRDDIPSLRNALCDLLIEAGSVILDVSRVTVRHAETTGALSHALLVAGGWPAGRLVLVGADPRLTAALRTTGVSRDVLSVGDLTLARRQLDHRPERVSRRLRLSPAPTGMRRAHTFVRRVGVDWNIRQHLTAMQAITSALLTNAVNDTLTPCSLTISLSGEGLRIGLRDFNVHRPPAAEEAAWSETALSVIAELSRNWGIIPRSDGKIVWSVLAVG